jgi:hypothetical protein
MCTTCFELPSLKQETKPWKAKHLDMKGVDKDASGSVKIFNVIKNSFNVSVEYG